MKKIYLAVLVCFAISFVNAQRSSIFKGKGHIMNLKSGRSILNGLSSGSGCDTLNTALFNDSVGVYPLYDTTDGIYGFLTGLNSFGNLGDAQYFDASALSDSFVTDAYIVFWVASTNDGTKVVPVNVYDGTGDTVGAIIGTYNLTMQSIITDVNNSNLTHVIFSPAVKLPASKQFFVGVDYSALSYNRFQYDTLAIASTEFNAGSGAWEDDNPAFVYPSGWISIAQDWSSDLGLFIFPLLSTGQTCSSSLPVQLTSFTAQTKNNDVLLNWQVAQEQNMKEYDVERAGSNLQFSYIGAVQATNSPLSHSYSYTDVNALAGASANLYYRLKQINKDGSIKYSNVIKVIGSNGALSIKVVNPFNNTVQLHISSPVTQTMQAAIYDLQGRKVAELGTQALSTGDNLVNMQAGGLPKGIYILTVTTGNTVYKYKILN